MKSRVNSLLLSPFEIQRLPCPSLENGINEARTLCQRDNFDNDVV